MLPESIPASVWDEFKAHRKKLRRPMTDYAETLILTKLMRWQTENGANPIDVLNESIEKGWTGVFLNGHGKVEATKTTQMEPKCCSCGGSLQGGYVHTGLGRQCHQCR
jgi:hypothetical protein